MKKCKWCGQKVRAVDIEGYCKKCSLVPLDEAINSCNGIKVPSPMQTIISGVRRIHAKPIQS